MQKDSITSLNELDLNTDILPSKSSHNWTSKWRHIRVFYSLIMNLNSFCISFSCFCKLIIAVQGDMSLWNAKKIILLSQITVWIHLTNYIKILIVFFFLKNYFKLFVRCQIKKDLVFHSVQTGWISVKTKHIHYTLKSFKAFYWAFKHIIKLLFQSFMIPLKNSLYFLLKLIVVCISFYQEGSNNYPPFLHNQTITRLILKECTFGKWIENYNTVSLQW